IFPDTFPEAVLSTTGSSRIRFKSEVIIKNYGLYYLFMYKPEMQRLASTGVQAFLNLSHIKSFRVPVPPIELQKVFSDFMNRFNASKIKLNDGLQEKDYLFSSLSQRAFRGELSG
ncbi:MAG: restriction endonuclease subunit S, partial [Spirochaetota bacterium]|nr:restriction endonuclease subunit S [Spirochaetota bacterium]